MPKKPNFLFLLTDDQGWEDLGCFGHCACFGRHRIKTPHLDELARQGVRFTNFYTNSPVCSPSRVGMMTGQYPARQGIDYAIHGLRAQDEALGQKHELNPAVPNLASVLRAAGYETAHYGKWHLSGTGERDEPDAGDYGFDHWACNGMKGAPLFREDRGEKKCQHMSSEAIVNRSIEFLEERDPSRPFLLNVWFMDPHGTLDPSPEQMEEFRNLTSHPNDSDPNRDPGALRVYYSVIANLDRQIGRLLARLRELGLEKDTVVVFTSDNGPAPVWDPGTANSGAGRTGPFRGLKASLYEGGVRMPCIVRWPGRAPRNRVDDQTVLSGTDLLPTFCALAGVKPPPDLDGQDMTRAITGTPVRRSAPLFWEFRFGAWGRHIDTSLRYAMRDGKWKLMMNASGRRFELFDLSRDPSETANCAKYEPAIAKRMAARLKAWARTLPSWGKDDYEWMRTYPWPETGDIRPGGTGVASKDALGGGFRKKWS